MDISLGKHRNDNIRPIQPLQDKEVVGLIGPGVELEGKIKATSGTLMLNSLFKGSVASEGSVVVGEEGEVEADINAKVVSVVGRLKGTVHASGMLEIKENGIVLGDIWTPVLVVNPGGYLEGQCHMPAPEAGKQATAPQPVPETAVRAAAVPSSGPAAAASSKTL